MPAPAKTSDAAILVAARRILEAHGLGALTMQAVADAVGVRPPSLYKRFEGREALLAALESDTLARLGAMLGEAALGRAPLAALEAQAHAFRRFARENPHAYAQIYAPEATRGVEVDAARRDAVAPALEALAALVGAGRALAAARTLTAYLHGFVSIENAGLFRLGGDVDEAFRAGIELILRGIETGDA
ncbi:TetR/AcrR family transcriptional regulator [Salinarimonas chemoclinalis]|uniref:TetR/AcrR family transcriptional regulator n=1 Tax=Salinarimonas chemoclinalis TaxID=3241599 RepID=UPI003558D46E